MRIFFSFVVAVMLACTQQSVGQRCEQDQDCNSQSGELCRVYGSSTTACEVRRDPDSGVPPSCVCCPQDRAAAEAIFACRVARVVEDAAATDAPAKNVSTSDGPVKDVTATDRPADDVVGDAAEADRAGDAAEADRADAGMADRPAVDAMDATAADR